MSLREVQTFLAEYVRDSDVRRRCDGGELTSVLDGRELTEEERGLIEQIELADLTKVAETVRRERFDRLSSVFALLFDHLAPHCDVPALYRRFDDEHRHGWWQRRAEIRRFEAFVVAFIVDHRLPPYLVDLCRLCSAITTVAESPKEEAPAHADPPGAVTVRGNYRAVLRRPYEVLSFRYNVLPLLDDPDTVTQVTTPGARKVLVQRIWDTHKRCQVFDLAEEPLIGSISEAPASVLELAGRLPAYTYETLFSEVAELHREGIVHLVVPPELAGELTRPGGR
ncbi:hypothetical protein [Streptomyces sp. NPDC019937]|uniref:hypothetical protein n=1 Tax=Streptomyces sp. NPDC019937 TaxID=3154787 RepID=UPI0033CEF4E2